MILPICVGHRQPEFPVWRKFQSIGYRPQSVLGEMAERVEIPVFSKHDISDKDLSEYYHLFRLARILRSETVRIDNPRLLIIHYRRFLSTRPLGITSQNQVYARTIKPSDVPEDSAHLIPSYGSNWFCSPILDLQRTIYEQFANHHPLRELIKLLASLTSRSLFSDEDARAFLSERRLVAVATLGLSRLEVFLDIMAKLETAVIAYLEDWRNPKYVGYQRRILGFLCERLHSFLLIRQLEAENALHPTSIGHQIVVTHGSRIVPSI
ncbi:MAG: hypothetical protein EBU08_04890 [Micrococcales bacterium]|nr:hypothetical protein [Micrococcales bacterium]